jgi:hypothetical protein
MKRRSKWRADERRNEADIRKERPKSKDTPPFRAAVRFGFRIFGFRSSVSLLFTHGTEKHLESVLFSAQGVERERLREVLKNAAEHSPDAGDFKKASFEEVVAALDALIKEHEAAQWLSAGVRGGRWAIRNAA